MARNQVFHDADRISLPVPAGTVSGDPVTVGGLHGVAQTDRATATNFGGGNEAGQATVWLDGAFELEVDAAVEAGAPVYHAGDATTRSAELTATAPADGATPFGHALAATSAAGPATIRIA